MSVVEVDAAARRLRFADLDADLDMPCVIGRGGPCAADAKREGDGCTPIGCWPIRAVLLRPGRVAPPPLALPWRWTRPDDGWSDDPADSAYNRPVRLPRARSTESLQRVDALYDIIVVLGHNDAPPVPGAGSAIFFHLWTDAQATEGCVAVAREDMLRILPLLRPGDAMRIG
ncbi:MAG: L,D-transpeptidase family protein [Sphingobium sp.]|nr:L,D-transpeptidase family protein [Sphingobium sp.]